MFDTALIMFALALISCLVSCIALLLPSRGPGAAQSSADAIIDRVLALFGLRELTENHALVTRLKQAGLSGRKRVALYILARLLFPVLAVVAGFGFAMAFPDPERSVAWIVSVVLAAGLLGYVLPDLYLSRRIKHRQAAVKREWPDMLDMMLLSLEAGLSLDAALREAANRLASRAPVLFEEINTTLVELVYLADRKKALSNFASRIDLPSVSLVITALLQAERYGTPIAVALRTTIRDQRATRMSEAERKAAALPARLTIPMIVFFLPILFVVIFTPGILLYMLDG